LQLRGNPGPERRVRLDVPRILLIEDNENLAFGLKRTLEAEGHEVAISADGREGLTQANRWAPALVVLDLMLPGMDGYEILKRLRQARHGMPVLILTARGEEADKLAGFRLGADDYVTKPFGVAELLARVDALLRRSRPADVERLSFADVEVDLAAHSVTKGGRRVALTPKEYELLITLLRCPGVVMSRPMLLKTVWGHQADVLTRTVDIHIGELRRKVETNPTEPRHLVTVWKAGYRFDP
jgi:DNA-binding response OmpR family regulator